jgi:Domain of unknown function (DUF4328)/Protein of unknown function (DUF2510)
MSLPPPAPPTAPYGGGPPLQPAGWYADPWYAGYLRWWDGTAWTPHVAPSGGQGVDPTSAVASTEATGTWLRRALYATPFTQALALALIFGSLRKVFDSIGSSPGDPRAFNNPGGWGAVGQLLSLVSTVLLVLRMVWLYRATKAARALGLPTRRDAGLACAGWLIPIVNFWWPFQSVGNLFPPQRRPRSTLGWWWAAYLVGSIVGTFGLFAVLFAGAYNHWSATPTAVAALLFGAFGMVWAVLEVQLVDQVAAAHRELLGSRLGVDRASYP